MATESSETREWLSVREIQDLLGIGATKSYELVSSGQIPSVRIGRAIRVSRRELERWLEDQHTSSTVRSSLR
jgi:excisionase family DNA binding protein